MIIITTTGLKVKENLHNLLRCCSRLTGALPRNWFSLSVFASRALVKLCQMTRVALVARMQSFP